MHIVAPVRTTTPPPSAADEGPRLNRWDIAAAAAGAAVGETAAGVTLTAVVVGPETVEDHLAERLPAGVDEVIRVWDPVVDDMSPVDIAQQRQLLGAALRSQQPDLACIGIRRPDYGFEATGPALAVELGYTWATAVTGLQAGEGTVVVYQEIEGGQEIRMELPLPAVVSIYAESTTGSQQEQAVPGSVTHVTTDDLGVTLPEAAVTVTESVTQTASAAYNRESTADTVAHIESVLDTVGVSPDE